MGYTETRCWCGTHVHTGTKIVSYVLIGLAIFSIVSNFLLLVFDPKGETIKSHRKSDPVADRVMSIVGQLLQIGLVSLMLYGLNVKRPGFYIPHLILTFLGLIFVGLAVIVMIIATVMSFLGSSLMAGEKGENTGIDFGFSFLMLVLTIFLGVFAWLYMYLAFIVPNRSRKALMEEKYGPGA